MSLCTVGIRDYIHSIVWCQLVLLVPSQIGQGCPLVRLDVVEDHSRPSYTLCSCKQGSLVILSVPRLIP